MHYVSAKGILSAKNGMNLYRGCQHGCIYCDSRSDCYQMEHDFEDIEVKENALILLERALSRKRKPCMIGTGSMSDPYMPLERELRFTRRALELIDRYGFGATMITKSDLILPFLNDTPENLNGILDYCQEAGVHGIICFGMGVTLRAGNREYFYQQLDRHFPSLKEVYIRRYGNAYMLDSPNSRELTQLFHHRCTQAGILHDNEQIFRYLSQFEEKPIPQMSLF